MGAKTGKDAGSAPKIVCGASWSPGNGFSGGYRSRGGGGSPCPALPPCAAKDAQPPVRRASETTPPPPLRRWRPGGPAAPRTTAPRCQCRIIKVMVRSAIVVRQTMATRYAETVELLNGKRLKSRQFWTRSVSICRYDLGYCECRHNTFVVIVKAVTITLLRPRPPPAATVSKHVQSASRLSQANDICPVDVRIVNECPKMSKAVENVRGGQIGW